ncbi:MAG: PIG-L family deacetylase, partial [Vicinamibacterales bacterium]
MKRLLLAFLLVAWAIGPRAHAQLRVAPVDLDQGHIALGLALRHLGNTGIFMMATAHPDDENNGLLVMLNRGQGYRTTLATATRGNGGQNEIGPELSEALGVLRTEELHAIHRFDGAEQYFTRAVDFGYSFSIDETYEKWGRDEIIGDYVRLICTIRPDVMTALTPTGSGGGQHHQASALLAREAYRAAGDPRRYPEQIAEGLHPWRPRKFYFAANVGDGRRAGASAVGQLTVNIGGYDSLLGRTWSEVGAEARSMHKCQGTDQLLRLPGPASATYTLAESSVGSLSATESTLFDGVDTSIGGLAQLAAPLAPAELTAGLEAIATAIQTAQTRFSTETDGATVAPLLSGLRATKALRAALAGMTLSEGSRFDLDARLAQKEREFEHALVIASRVRIEVLADDQVVVPGQSVRVTVLVANRGDQDLAVKRVSFEGLEGTATCAFTAVTAGRGPGAAPAPAPAEALASVPPGVAGQCAPALTIPLATRVTEPYWHRAGEAGRYSFDTDAPFGLPYRPTPFRATLAVSIGGSDEVKVQLPVQARYQGDVFSGEKRGDLLVVPPVSVSVSPSIAIISRPRVRSTPSAPVDNERQIR